MKPNSYLTKNNWKPIKGTNRYEDPLTEQVFAQSHAVIVQEGRDNEKTKNTALKKELRRMKEIQDMREWDPYNEKIDELYPPPGSKSKKKPRRK